MQADGLAAQSTGAVVATGLPAVAEGRLSGGDESASFFGPPGSLGMTCEPADDFEAHTVASGSKAALLQQRSDSGHLDGSDSSQLCRMRHCRYCKLSSQDRFR